MNKPTTPCARCGDPWLMEFLRHVLRQGSKWRFRLLCPRCWEEVVKEEDVSENF